MTPNIDLNKIKDMGGMSSVTLPPIESLACSRAPSGSWEFHVWNQGAKPGDKCQCGKLDYSKSYNCK